MLERAVVRARAMLLNARKRLGDSILPSSGVDPRTGFDLWSAVYEREADNPLSLMDALVWRDFARRCDLRDGRVIDYGCGLGRHWPTLLGERPSELAGADISEGMLKRAQAAFPSHRFVHLPADPGLHAGALASLGSVDVVTTALVLHYVRDLPATFEAFRSVLNPGGRVGLTLLHPGIRGQGAVSFRVGLSRFELEVAPFDLDELQAAWRAAGFRKTHEVHSTVDSGLREAFDQFGGRDIYRRMKGQPLVYGACLVAEGV